MICSSEKDPNQVKITGETIIRPWLGLRHIRRNNGPLSIAANLYWIGRETIAL